MGDLGTSLVAVEIGAGFGYKIEWLAVRHRGAESVAAVLGLGGLAPAAYSGRWLITPPVDGWTLAASIDMEPPADSRFVSWLAGLSASLGEVQYFGTHRVVEYHCWGLASGGVVSRVFGYLGERDEVLRQVGERTPEERALGVGWVPDDAWWDEWNETEDDDTWPWPTEETVMRLAGRWSVDPQTFEGAPMPARPWIAERAGSQ